MTDSILDQAKAAVDGPRALDYGRPERNHGTTGAMFGVWLRRRQEAIQREGEMHPHEDAIRVCAFNICQKLSRLANSPDHLDSLVDTAGYARNWQMILEAGSDV